MKTSVLCAAITSASLLGCSGSSGDVQPAASAGELLMAELAGGSFLLESAEGYTPVEGTTLGVSFGESTFGFSGGCNAHGGDYSIEGEATLVIQGFGSTAMGCDNALHEMDTWLSEYFTARPTMDFEGDRLTFTGTEATLVFLDREVADPDRALAGTLWTIDTIFEGDVAMGGWNPDPAPNLTFASDGSFTAQTPCTSVSADYVVDGNEITFADVAYEHDGCEGSEYQDLDASILNVLTEGTVTYEIDAARLRLERGSIGLGAWTE